MCRVVPSPCLPALSILCCYLVRADCNTQFEWPATWCYMSVGQCFVALAVEFYSIHKQRKAVAAGAAGVVGNGKPVHAVTVNTALNGHDMDDTVAHGLPDTPGKPSKKKE